MKFLTGGRRSLRWKLVSRVASVLALLMLIVNAAFIALILWVLPDAQQADYNVRPAISRAIGSENGQLLIREDEGASLRSAAPGLWFLASAPDGRRTEFGDVPAVYESLVRDFPDVRYIDLRGPDGSPLTGITADLETDAGRLRVLYGGTAMPNPQFLVLLWDMKLFYLPLILGPVMVVFIAVPLVIGRALKGMSRTMQQASQIDIHRLGERLPKEGVIEELRPLIDTINAALGRIDDGVRRDQRFMANAAHELRTPIAILQTRIETLRHRPIRERLMLDVARLGATAEHLLDFERFGSVRLVEKVDLVDLCESVAADIAPIAIAAGYQLGFETRKQSQVVEGDRVSLERAVTNLAMNAVEHAGGSGNITIEVTEKGDVEVADEGPGVPADKREKVFEPFFRVVPKSTGAGLGLSLVRQIAEAHGGSVDFIEQSGGARIRLAFS